ncbi:hypothetical protein [Microbacterium sp. VKM Ac-2923]|uniref:hypothetical protein n=1 Tax=Microbacterium sp. VKM Ac-2923 TaxID=2929476 RepID=UPI001FB515AA|nr:hypothetical protein [Microbacterium sp. VKM Ac-2923]MCJ1707551.1 hypothetical protein [Microbacterium sp. VKM Ac-2923]
MIHGQQSGQQAGSVWGIAMSTAMGNGIVPRSIEEPRARTALRWPWSRTRDAGESMAALRRA